MSSVKQWSSTGYKGTIDVASERHYALRRFHGARLPRWRAHAAGSHVLCCVPSQIQAKRLPCHRASQRRSQRGLSKSTRARLYPASATAASSEPDTAALSTQERIVAAVFPAAAAGLIVLSFAMVLVPSQLCQILGKACPTAQAAALMRLVAFSWCPTIAVLRVLGEAVEHKRTGSQTYQRLACTIVALSTCSAATVAFSFNAMTSARLFTWISFAACIALSGAAATVARLHTSSSSLRKALSPPARDHPAMKYWLLMVAAPLGLPLLCLLLSGGISAFHRGSIAAWTQWGRVLAMACWSSGVSTTVVAFTLKDAAERDRLGGSTFRVLTKWLSWMRYLFMAYAAANMLNAAHVWMQGNDWMQILFVGYALLSIKWLHGDYVNLMKTF